MKILYDNIIFSLQKSGGISVYWYELISRMLYQSDINCSFIEEKSKNCNIFRNQLAIDAKNIFHTDYKWNNYLSRYRNLDFNIDNNKFIFHSSYYRTLSKSIKRKNSVKEVVTVHDFTYERFNRGLKKWVHSWQKKKAIQSADVVICISENTKNDLLHFYPQFSKKDIRVIYNGVSEQYAIIPELKKDNHSTPYFLFVGSRTDYKNFDFVVKAVSKLENYVLKIVGGGILSNHEIMLLEKNISERWHFYSDVNNIELNILYNKAFALLYPSSYEGFGIPIVEAMKAGCPFIALNGSSITEVAGEAGFLMKELNIKEFYLGVEIIKNNRFKIVELGLLQANFFSWDKCFDEILEIYKELDNKINLKNKT
jgi:glycosyltransferase involved in cell wall biosynthesis